jgi:hypothetical protein
LNNYKVLGFLGAVAGITFLVFFMLFYLNIGIRINSSNGYATLNPTLQTPYLVLGIVFVLVAFGGFLQSYKIEKASTIRVKVYEKCFNCAKELSPNVEHVELTKNLSNGYQGKVKLCKECILKEFDKQDGVCPQCKKPLKWNGNLREFIGEWYHPKCAYEIQQGKHNREVKEITQKVIVKVRCQYCKYPYDESLDKCPQCGAKRA